VGRNFILVLDDYHLIHEQPIHELLSLLLQHPPQGMHLVIVTRLEPPLPLGVLRARHQLAEIRGQDLRFSRAEIAAFVERALKVSLSDEALAMLAEKTEGWAAGLRLAMLTLRESDDVGSHMTGLHAENRYVLDYLMSEVLAQLPPAMRSFLLKTSLLDQVCSPLSKALIGSDDPECQPQEFLVWLQQANMLQWPWTRAANGTVTIISFRRSCATSWRARPAPMRLQYLFDRPCRYRIRVQGQLSASWSSRLSGMVITIRQPTSQPAVTTLTDEVRDQAALLGVLNALYDMGCPLLKVERLDVVPAAPNTQPHGETYGPTGD
jgi:hypothetical protein